MGTSLGRKIKALRTAKGLTQKALAQKLNVNRSTLANWEIGRTYPNNLIIQKLADCFNVSTDYLLGRAENPLIMLEEINNDYDFCNLDLRSALVNRYSKLSYAHQLLTNDDKDWLLALIDTAVSFKEKGRQEAARTRLEPSAAHRPQKRNEPPSPAFMEWFEETRKEIRRKALSDIEKKDKKDKEPMS